VWFSVFQNKNYLSPKSCHRQINSSGLPRRTQQEKQRLKQRSEQCELQANEMFNNIRGKKFRLFLKLIF